jgi:hypothetical protein
LFYPSSTIFSNILSIHSKNSPTTLQKTIETQKATMTYIPMKGTRSIHVVGRMIQGGSFLGQMRNAGRKVQSFGQKLHSSASSKVSSFRDKLNSIDVKKQMQALPAHLQQTGMQNTITRELKQKGDFLRKNGLLTSGGNVRGSGLMDPLSSVRVPTFAAKKGGASRNNIRINL